MVVRWLPLIPRKNQSIAEIFVVLQMLFTSLQFREPSGRRILKQVAKIYFKDVFILTAKSVQIAQISYFLIVSFKWRMKIRMVCNRVLLNNKFTFNPLISVVSEREIPKITFQYQH